VWGTISGSDVSGNISGNAGSATNLAGGAANQIAYQTGSGATAFATAPTTSGTALTWNGSAFTWASAGGASISNDTTTNASYYPVWANATSGTMTTAYVSSTKLSFNPSTGLLTATGFSGPLTGSSTSVAGTAAIAVQSNYQATINTTTPGLGNYGIHFGGQTTADYASGITWNGGTGTTGAQAGIYVQGSGAYGTKMYIATTDSYASGAKTAISIDQVGLANFVRSRPTALGNVMLDAGNYTGYSAFSGAVSGSRIWAGYDSGVASSVNTSNWFRTSGAVGMYYASYGRGIQPADTIASYGNNAPYGTGLNGWQGWSVGTNNDCILMTNGANHGFYNPVGGYWQAIWDDSGNVTWSGNVTAYSDLRLKENVREIDNVVARRDTLAKAAIKYERDGRTRVGYGAQTLRDNGCAEFVMEADDAMKMTTGLGTLSVDYGETAAVLAVTSKMTDDRVAALEARIAQLENTWFKKVTNACRNLIARR